MKLHYCDLCDCPIHTKKYLLMIAEEEDVNTLQTPLQPSSRRRSEDVQEICESCKHILDKLFSMRKKGLTDIASAIEEIFNLPCSKDKKKKRGK